MWDSHKWPPPPIEFLPSSGLIIDGVCAGFIYETNSKFWMMEWIISNKQTEKSFRNKCLDTLIKELKSYAIIRGCKALFISTNSQALIKRLTEGHGFMISDTGITNLVCSLGGN